MNELMLQSLFFWFSTFICLFVVFVAYPALIVSIARQKLFRLRDELFDYVSSSENVGFDIDAYIKMRKLINSVIRFMHEATWLRILLFYKFEMHSKSNLESAKDIRDDIKQAIASLDQDSQDVFKGIDRQVIFVCNGQMIVRSPFLIFLSLFSGLCIAFSLLSAWCNEKLKTSLQCLSLVPAQIANDAARIEGVAMRSPRYPPTSRAYKNA